MQRLLKVDNIMYRVKNLEKARVFYCDVLGLQEVWEDKERKMLGFRLAKSDAEIVIHNDPNVPDFTFSFLVDNVQEFIKEKMDQGLTLTFGPIPVRCGFYALLQDPDGNNIPIIDLSAFGGVPQYNK